MAQQVDVEGTSTSGEAHEFETLMHENSVSADTIQKLMSNGFKTIDVLKVIENNELTDICQEFEISTSQKVKLKAVIRKLQVESVQSPSNVIIDKDERVALTKMAKKIKAMEESVSLINETTKDLDKEADKHRNDIQSAFKELHQSLDERESVLLSKLNELIAAKKSNLLKIANTINAKKADSQRKLNECELKVTKPTKIHEIESRIQEISGIAKEIENVEVVTMENDAILYMKINVPLKTGAVVADISGFRSVLLGPAPVLLSLTDNKDTSVSVEWTLKEQPLANIHFQSNKLKMEWSEIKSDDVTQFDEKWEHQKEVEVRADTETTTTKVHVGSKSALYVFRIQYDWSPWSELKTVSVEQVADSWDSECTSQDLTLSGSSITYNTHQGSSFGKLIVSEGIHSWTIRVDDVTGGWTLFGVWKSQFDPVLDKHFERFKNQAYALVVDTGKLSKPSKTGSFSKKKRYCSKGKAGDVIKMTLNLIDCTLSYTVNETDCGKAFDVEKVSYRMAATLRGKDTQFTLLSYESP